MLLFRRRRNRQSEADFDLAFLDLRRNTIFQFRIQAKRLTPHLRNWRISSYKELAHPHESGEQVRTLTDPGNLAGSIPTVPLYAFYNLESVCAVASIEGIALADAFEINWRMPSRSKRSSRT